MRVHNDKQETHSAHAKRNESLLSENVRIFASKRIVVSEDLAASAKSMPSEHKLAAALAGSHTIPMCVLYGQLYSYQNRPALRP